MPRLRVVDGLTLAEAHRQVLRPGQLVRGRDGKARRLPRWFYEVPSWEAALETQLAPNFKVWEFLNVDVREAEALRSEWPRYLPCAVSALAAFLELLRREVGTYVHIAANGGYRSPAHRLSTHASAHCWGTAANIYRVGDDWMDDAKTIARYARIAEKLLPGLYVRPYGSALGQADYHLHVDLGWSVTVPHGTAGERARREDGVDQGSGSAHGIETAGAGT